MTDNDIRLVRESWAQIEAAGPQASDLLYDKLFTLEPELRRLFKHTPLTEQGQRLLMMVGVGVQMLDRFERLAPSLAELGQRHAGYGVRWQHYAVFGEALLQGLAELLGPVVFTPDCKAAWVEVYTTVVTAMHRETGAEVPMLGPQHLGRPDG